MSGPDQLVADRLTRLLDRGAIGLSGLCLVHCLAFPLVIASLPAMAHVLPQEAWVHPLILAAALPLAAAALWRGWRRHGDPRPVALGGGGLALLTLGLLVGHGSSAEIVLTVVGGVTLAAAHTLNWRLDHRRHDHRRRSRRPDHGRRLPGM